MYKTGEEKTVVEDEEITLYGIADENRFYFFDLVLRSGFCNHDI